MELIKHIRLIFDEFDVISEEYDISGLVEEEELLVFLLELTSLLPQSDHFQMSHTVSSWPLYQTIERIGNYFERVFKNNDVSIVLHQTASIRCSRLVARWCVVVLRLTTRDGEYQVITGINDQLQSNREQLSNLKLLCQQLEKSGFTISSFNFARYFYSALLLCYNNMIVQLQDTIRFIPIEVREQLFPHLLPVTSKNNESEEEMKGKHSIAVDLLDMHDSQTSTLDPITRIVKLRNLVIASLCLDQGNDMVLNCFSRYQYLRNFSSPLMLVEHLKNHLQSMDLASSFEYSLISEDLVKQLWLDDVHALTEVTMGLFDDYLAVFKLFSK